MLVLGKTSDDKGAQLETLIRLALEGQGYKRVRANVVGAGGNELDVVAERESEVVGNTQVTPLICEAKAYADAVVMRIWHQFLGKLFTARVEDPNTIGILVALNSVNGNVAGSYSALRKRDSAVFVIEGGDLLSRAKKSGEIGEEDAVLASVMANFKRKPTSIEPAYYGGGFLWVIRWVNNEYSVVDGHGSMLSSSQVEDLRGPLEATISGSLLATDEARAHAEAQHAARLSIICRLLCEDSHSIQTASLDAEALSTVQAEPYSRVSDGVLKLIPAHELDAPGVSRLFLSLFEGPVPIAHLSFMAERRHVEYMDRLIAVLPDLQSGFTLEDDGVETLRAIGPLFPSIWEKISAPIELIVTHRNMQPELENEAILASDRAVFWEEVIEAVRTDFGNVFLRGFLYDELDIAEIEQKTEVIVKSKQGVVGEITTKVRNAIAQLSGEYVSEAGTRHVLMRVLPTTEEPWEKDHPVPEPEPDGEE